VLLLKEQLEGKLYACYKYFVIAYCKQHRRSQELSVGGGLVIEAPYALRSSEGVEGEECGEGVFPSIPSRRRL